MAVTALMMVTNMKAQEGYEDTKHEVSIAVGVGSNTQLRDTNEDYGYSLSIWNKKNDKYIGPISAEYYYHINEWLGIGGIFVYGNYKNSKQNTNYFDYYTDNNDNIILYRRLGKSSNYTLLPAVKFNFVRKTHFGLYSKAALGVTLLVESFEYIDYDTRNIVHTDNGNALRFNWQFSFIGVEVGSPYLRGFAELGTGEQGVVCAGIRYKF